MDGAQRMALGGAESTSSLSGKHNRGSEASLIGGGGGRSRPETGGTLGVGPL